MKIIQKVLVEKYRKWDYIDNKGYYIWTNKYGDIIKIEDRNGLPKITYSAELVQDFNAYGIDIEAELTAILSRELAIEMDNKIIQEIIAKKGWL
jgi:hypothetical protein